MPKKWSWLPGSQCPVRLGDLSPEFGRLKRSDRLGPWTGRSLFDQLLQLYRLHPRVRKALGICQIPFINELRWYYWPSICGLAKSRLPQHVEYCKSDVEKAKVLGMNAE